MTGSRPVVLTSPHPPGECLRRLAVVTKAGREHSGRIFGITEAGQPVPRLRGEVGRSYVSVTPL